MDRHCELELKFAADHVDPEAFKAWCMRVNPLRFKAGGGTDVYYRNGENVVRHRHRGGAGELTVKKRKGDDITDRFEINLNFGSGTSLDDVKVFLLTTGYQEELRLQKGMNNQFWFAHGNAHLVVCMYEVSCNGRTNRYVEVEVEAQPGMTADGARWVLDIWSGVLAEEFDLADPLTESLYEIFSGRRYLSV